MLPHHSGPRLSRRGSTSSLYDDAQSQSFGSPGLQLPPLTSFSGFSTSSAYEPSSSLTLPPLRNVLSTDSFTSPRRSSTREKDLSYASSSSSSYRSPDTLLASPSFGTSTSSLRSPTPLSYGSLPPLPPLTAPSTFTPLPSGSSVSSTLLVDDGEYDSDASFGSGLGGYPRDQRTFDSADSFFAFARAEYAQGSAGSSSTAKSR